MRNRLRSQSETDAQRMEFSDDATLLESETIKSRKYQAIKTSSARESVLDDKI